MSCLWWVFLPIFLVSPARCSNCFHCPFLIILHSIQLSSAVDCRPLKNISGREIWFRGIWAALGNSLHDQEVFSLLETPKRKRGKVGCYCRSEEGQINTQWQTLYQILIKKGYKANKRLQVQGYYSKNNDICVFKTSCFLENGAGRNCWEP